MKTNEFSNTDSSRIKIFHEVDIVTKKRIPAKELREIEKQFSEEDLLEQLANATGLDYYSLREVGYTPPDDDEGTVYLTFYHTVEHRITIWISQELYEKYLKVKDSKTNQEEFIEELSDYTNLCVTKLM